VVGAWNVEVIAVAVALAVPAADWTSPGAPLLTTVSVMEVVWVATAPVPVTVIG
jgi:hypothetical protein